MFIITTKLHKIMHKTLLTYTWKEEELLSLPHGICGVWKYWKYKMFELEQNLEYQTK